MRFVGSEVYGWWSGKSGYLSNYVHETNASYWAFLWFNNTNSYSTTISGVWSPEVCNPFLECLPPRGGVCPSGFFEEELCRYTFAPIPKI